MNKIRLACLVSIAITVLVSSNQTIAQCDLTQPCSTVITSSNTALSVRNNGTGRAVEGRGSTGIGVIGISDNRGVVGTQGITSCAGRYAIGGCATTGDGILGRSPNRAIIGVQGGGSCAGTYAVGGCATNGDGVVGRSKNGLAGRFDGQVRVQTLQITGGSDLAEPFEVDPSRSVKPGMVLSINPEHPGQLRVSDKSYDRTVAGIVSGANGLNAGIMLRQDGTMADGNVAVALTGRVYCLADASNGSIEPGDLLTTSDIPGHAMKAGDHSKAQGAIIGKAMTGLRDGKGLILTLVSLQ